MMSLHRRVSLSAALVLAAFVVLTSLALERAFRESAESARAERLLGQVYLLMSAAEEAGDSLVLPDTPPEPRLALPGSGLYAQVSDDTGAVVWRSPSAVGLAPPFATSVPPGEKRFERRADAEGRDWFVQSFGVTWATGETPRRYTFSVAEDLAGYHQQIAGWRNALAVWLAGAALFLLAALWAVLRWGLLPLRRVGKEIQAVQGGEQERLQGRYPAEIQLLTENINALLAHERTRQTRFSNALADLAHSLKTPLAVLRGLLAEGRVAPDAAAEADAQIGRMDRLVGYHLQRARAGAGALAAPIPVRPAAERVLASLAKVYRDKAVTAEIDIDPAVAFRGAEDDLLEVLGNLLDNAFKWCASRVRVSAGRDTSGFALHVEDDGRGMDEAAARSVLERGVRADESVPGHGIGLAVVRDIAAAYGGRVEIGRSEMGGARVALTLGDGG